MRSEKVQLPHLSNQFPITPRADRGPPICTPSLFHLSCPWKIDTDVHLTSPSLVKPTVPFEVKSLASVYWGEEEEGGDWDTYLANLKMHCHPTNRQVGERCLHSVQLAALKNIPNPARVVQSW